MATQFSLNEVGNGELDATFKKLYGAEMPDEQRKRWETLISKFKSHFSHMHNRDHADAGKDEGVYLVSSPGRTELGGNHTDHNNGKVIAASIQLDQIAAVLPSEDNKVRFVSEEYEHPIEIDLTDVSKKPEEKGTAESLIRGIAGWFKENGQKIGGFTAYSVSDVAMGSGLSSSACFEVLVGQIFNTLYNNGAVSPEQLSIAGQWSENNYFEKPCGLMDQLACAVGGIIAIDFRDPGKPSINRIDYEFRKHGLRLCIVDTGGSHADLTGDYASVPKEMRCIASRLGGKNLRDIDAEKFFSAIEGCREECGDRAVLRAIHFYRECDRVDEMLGALRNDTMDEYLRCVAVSGSSSWRLLQNCIPTGAVEEQNVGVALGLSEHILGEEGVARVHGGGFAGTIQAYVPEKLHDIYVETMSSCFGRNAVTELKIRPIGVTFLSA